MIDTQILGREQEFFDHEAAALAKEDLLIPQDQIDRYRTATISPTNIPKDSAFAYMQPLEGKRVLDYGCGTGENACLLAACGARVTAFDLSPQAVERARLRAELHGLTDRIEFHVCSAGATGLEPGSFDAILGFAILHHLHMALTAIYQEVDRLLKPDGTAYFVEPVANSAFFRLLRPLIPIRRHATPDERQLLYRDFEPLQDYFPVLRIEHYYFLERMERVLGSWAQLPLRRCDHGLQRFLPFLKRYYGDVLVIARRA